MTVTNPGRAALRLDGNGEDLGAALARVVVVVLEIVRELLERQALRRVEGGRLSAEQVEQLGRALLAIRDRLDEVRDSLGLTGHEVDEAVRFAERFISGLVMETEEESEANRRPKGP